MFDFDNKLAVVTGAAGNLGQAVVAAFNDAGATCIAADINISRLEELYAGNERAVPFGVNLLEEASVAELAALADGQGGADFLANIAGGFRMGPLLQDTPVKDWDFMLDLNAKSAFLASRALLPQMLAKQAGKIVSVSARAADQAKGKMVPYCASKAAVLTFTEALAVENKHTGINVNCILPGTIDTPENRADMPDADYSKWVAPAALADVVLTLCSDTMRAVNGAAVPVYGES